MMSEINKTKHIPWNGFLYAILKIIAKYIRRIFKCKESVSDAFKGQLQNGPMLIVCNHASNYDFAYYLTPFKKEKVNFVVAENMHYSSKLFAFLFKHYHIISKKQFFADLTCIKNIKKYLDNGISVIICPEGKESSDGCTSVVLPSIARLIKMLSYPVGSIKIQGTGLVAPKWADKTKKGPTSATCDMLFSKEDLKEMKAEEIYSKLMDRLSFNEHEYQVEHGYTYKGKGFALGLQNILYRCPVCEKEFNLASIDNKLICRNCNSEFTYTNDGFIKSERIGQTRIDLWFKEQKNILDNELKNDKFIMEDDVDLYMENFKKNGYSFICKGHIKMNKKTLQFNSFEINEKHIKYLLDSDFTSLESLKNYIGSLVFDLKNYSSIANIPGYSIDMCDAKHAFRFVLTSRPSSAKYALAIEQLSR